MTAIITSRLRNTYSGYAGVSPACTAEQQEYIPQESRAGLGRAESGGNPIYLPRAFLAGLGFHAL